ncbi:MAG: flagellar M-ring protein FliF [Oscillospiraceae bacterium]|nr:flagellar M-ring protein FliF [Oscillospiraceae bacterium]
MDKTKETLLKFWVSTKEKWQSLSKTVRIVTVAVLCAVLVSWLLLAIVFNRNDYVTLYGNMSTSEVTEVVSAINALGFTDVRISGSDVLVPQNVEDNIRMQLSIQGYPKSTFNYDIWDNSIGMFSTDKEKAVKEQHQLQELIMATLNTIPEVERSSVIISMTERDPYVIRANENYEVKAAVMVTLRRERYLNERQVNGIYNLVMTSVPGLQMENISLTDGNGILLMSDTPSASEQLLVTQEKFRIRQEFQSALEESLQDGLKELLTPFYREFAVNVTATLDYGNITEESRTYTPSIEEAGTAGGMLSATVDQRAWGGFTPEGGMVGAPIEADIAPDYPTMVAEGDSDIYYQSLRQADYKVNEVIRQYQSSDYTVDRISASVTIDSMPLALPEQTALENMVANAIGTDPEFVTVWAGNRVLPGPEPFEGPEPGPVRNTLIFIIIALGVILIILFLLAIMTSGSKKRRQVRAGLAGIPSGMGSAEGMVPVGINPDTGEPFETFNITSLLPEEGAVDTKDIVLKREIRDFSAQNPDIVAQLIRQWMAT